MGDTGPESPLSVTTIGGRRRTDRAVLPRTARPSGNSTVGQLPRGGDDVSPDRPPQTAYTLRRAG